MKRLSALVAIAFVAWMLPSFQADGKTKAGSDAAQIIVELGDAVTFGEFTYDDATIEVSEEFFNPQGSIEFKFAGTPISLGAEFMMSENEFTGEYDDGDGSVDAERQKLVAFIRFGSKNGSYLRLGYANASYDFSNARISMPGELITDGEASSDMTTGADAEINLALGSTVQFALALGASYFIDAEYDWSYMSSVNGAQSGEAEADTISVRVRPELSFEVTDNLRVFVNGTLQGTTWDVDEDTDDATPDYVGIDVYSAVAGGIRYTFGL